MGAEIVPRIDVLAFDLAFDLASTSSSLGNAAFNQTPGEFPMSLAPLLEQIEIDSRNKDGISRITENFMSVDATCQLAIKEVNKLMVFDKNQIDQ